MSDLRARAWCFTINNYLPEDLESCRALKKKKISYLIFGEEVGDRTGTPHIQGYVRFENQRTRAQVAKLLPKAHLEVAKGSDVQNQTYCSKEQKFEEYGTPSKQGAREDLKSVVDAVDAGASMYEISRTYSYQAIKHAETLLKYKKQSLHNNRLFCWFYENNAMDEAIWFLEREGAEDEFPPGFYMCENLKS